MSKPVIYEREMWQRGGRCELSTSMPSGGYGVCMWMCGLNVLVDHYCNVKTHDIRKEMWQRGGRFELSTSVPSESNSVCDACERVIWMLWWIIVIMSKPVIYGREMWQWGGRFELSTSVPSDPEAMVYEFHTTVEGPGPHSNIKWFWWFWKRGGTALGHFPPCGLAHVGGQGACWCVGFSGISRRFLSVSCAATPAPLCVAVLREGGTRWA